MDTREKIVALNDAVRLFSESEWIVIPGLFDPLTATQAKRLAGLTADGRKIAAIVLEDGKSLLPSEARAALIAGLRAVSLVAIAHPNEWRAAVAGLTRVRVMEDPEAETARSAEFVQLILNRQNAAKEITRT